jgi:DNA-binding winged helix-turn-helix (wHTH) protein
MLSRTVDPAQTTGACPWCKRPPSRFVRHHGCSVDCTFEAGHDARTHEIYGADHQLLPRLDGRVQTGPLVIDAHLRQAFLGPYTVGLSEREWDLLSILAGSIGRTCTRQDIARVLFPSFVRGGEAEMHSLRVIKSRLIRRLEGAGQLIETVWLQGVRLNSREPSDYDGPPPPRRTAAYGAPRLETWSFHYPACRACETVIRPHRGHGLCSRCFARHYRARMRQASASVSDQEGASHDPC